MHYYLYTTLAKSNSHIIFFKAKSITLWIYREASFLRKRFDDLRRGPILYSISLINVHFFKYFIT